MTKVRAMRMIIVLAALVTIAAPELAFAAEASPKATLTCEVVDEGKRTKLPVRRIRIEAPVECKVSVDGAARAEPFAARIVTTWTDYSDNKKVPKKIDCLAGKVNGGAPWIAKLTPDEDFIGCMDFVIEARLAAPGAAANATPAWSKKLTIKQFCPD